VYSPKGNTGELLTRQVLEAYGLGYKDLGKVSYVSYSDAVSLMKDGHAVCFTLGTTIPASSVLDLAPARRFAFSAFRRQDQRTPEGECRLHQADYPGRTYPGQNTKFLASDTHHLSSVRNFLRRSSIRLTKLCQKM